MSKNIQCNRCKNIVSEVMKFMNDKNVREATEKIKVTQADVVVQKINDKPYYMIKYKPVGDDDYILGYGSYNIEFVFDWLSEEFEIVPEEKETQSDVNMDKLQRNILIELLHTRKECMEDNKLTANGMVAVIDALFYLVSGGLESGE